MVAESQRIAQSAQAERAAVEERLRGLQRAVAMLETEKKDAERQAVRLEKDKNALRNTLDKVSTVACAQQMRNLFLSVISLQERFCSLKNVKFMCSMDTCWVLLVMCKTFFKGHRG